MRVFVTGGAGYIGSVVCEALLKHRHEVCVFDALLTGHRAAVVPGATFVHGDLRDVERLRQALRPGTDAVLHFAARSLVSESQQDPLGYYNDNVLTTLNLLRCMQQRGVRRLVFSSTAAVYGEPEAQPIDESAPPLPTHAYGGSKRAIEMALEHAMNAGLVRAIFLRYFNAAGASQLCGEAHDPETHLIPNLLRSALARQGSARIFGDDYPTPDGTCVRDYVHVLDLADAHVRALEALDDGVCGAINVGGGDGASVRQVLDVVRRVTGCELEARVEARRPGDPPCLVADVRRAASWLGWRPRRTELTEIVGSAWEWLQMHPNGYAPPRQ